MPTRQDSLQRLQRSPSARRANRLARRAKLREDDDSRRRRRRESSASDDDVSRSRGSRSARKARRQRRHPFRTVQPPGLVKADDKNEPTRRSRRLSMDESGEASSPAQPTTDEEPPSKSRKIQDVEENSDRRKPVDSDDGGDDEEYSDEQENEDDDDDDDEDDEDDEDEDDEDEEVIVPRRSTRRGLIGVKRRLETVKERSRDSSSSDDDEDEEDLPRITRSRRRVEEGDRRYPKRRRTAPDAVAAAIAEKADKYLDSAKEDDEFFDYNLAAGNDDDDVASDPEDISLPPEKRRQRSESFMSTQFLFGGDEDKKQEAAPVRETETEEEPPSSAFAGVAGLAKQRAALEEMVLVPLRHPGVFESLGVGAPRGVLFYGPPGCGKTALARELAKACRPRVTFFARKGGDVLNKYVGEAERALTSLFEEARNSAPSIIFFDELDGLAPCRSRTVGGDDSNNQDSVVATLLALMDGLEDRGDVVVIGSTNRPEAIDPALRRPGRFDRELLFAPPNLEDRVAILKLHTNHWSRPPSDRQIRDVAERADGFCGADLKALAAEAAIVALRRHRPDLFAQQQDVSGGKSQRRRKPLAGEVVVRAQDFDAALNSVSPNARRTNAKSVNSGALNAAPLPGHQRALYGTVVEAAVRAVFPEDGVDDDEDTPAPGREDELEGDDFVVSASSSFDERREAARAALRARATGYSTFSSSTNTAVLIQSEVARTSQARLVASALLYSLDSRSAEHVDIGMGALLRESRTHSSLEAALAARVREARAMAETTRTAKATLFVPDAGVWWDTASETLKLAAQSLFRESGPLVIIATTTKDKDEDEPDGFVEFLTEECFEITSYQIRAPEKEKRCAYFECVLADVADAVRAAAEAAADADEAPRMHEETNGGLLPPLRPPPPPPPPKKEDSRQRARDEHCLRELRIFFRAVLKELRTDRTLAPLWRPVDPDECPEYYGIAKDPIDLSVVRARVDSRVSLYYPTLDTFLADLDKIKDNTRALASIMPGDARADDNAHAAANANDVARSMAHRFEQKVGWDLIKRCDDIEKKRQQRTATETDPQEPTSPLLSPENDPTIVATAAVRAAIAADLRLERATERDRRMRLAWPELIKVAEGLARKSIHFEAQDSDTAVSVISNMTNSIWRVTESLLAHEDPISRIPLIIDALASLSAP